MRAAIYTRVSTEEQAQGGVSLDMQREVCVDYCKRLALDIVSFWSDDGISSSVPLEQRPQGSRLAAQVAVGEIDQVIAYEGSRLWRDDVEGNSTARRWWALGVSLHYVRNGGLQDLADPDGEFRFGLDALLSRREVRVLRRRVSDAMQRIAETGRLPGGVVFGYDRDADKALAINDDEAMIVRELFGRAADGEPMTQLCAWLNREQVPQKKNGARWNTASVKRMLTNPIYKGSFRWGGEICEGTHEALVSGELWEQVQERLRLRSHNHGKRLKHFSPLFRCGLCGGPVHTQVQRRKYAGGTPYFLSTIYCHAQYNDACTHGPVSVTETKALAMVYRHTEILLSDGLLEKGIERAQANLSKREPENERARGRLDELQRERLVNLEAFRRGLVTAEDFALANRPLVEEEERLRSSLEIEDLTPTLAELKRIIRLKPATILRRLQGMGVEEQVTVLKGLYDRVEIHRGLLRFMHINGWLEPVDRVIPAYYSARRGNGVGF